MQRITSSQNAHIKNVLRLRQRRGREQKRRILIDGLREIGRALDAGIALDQLLMSDTFLAHEHATSLLAKLKADRVCGMVVPDRLFERISYGDRNDGVLAVAAPPARKLGDLSLTSRPLLAILEGIEKPGNVGAVVRTADAAGLEAVIVADGLTDLYNPNAIRASMGTIFSVPVLSCRSDQVIKWLAERPIQVVVARLDGSLGYDQANYREGTAFVLGSEATGVSKIWKAESFCGVQLPMAGVADSLNVAATAAVLFYEARRQRRLNG